MSLNDEQYAHVQALAKSPDKICGCGWFFKAECKIHCSHPNSQLPEEKEFRDYRAFMVERCAKIADDWVRENYRLLDIPEYKHSNVYRDHMRFAGETIAKRIRKV